MKMELTENQRAIKKLLDDVGINTDEIELAFTIENLTKKVEVLDNKLDEKSLREHNLEWAVLERCFSKYLFEEHPESRYNFESMENPFYYTKELLSELGITKGRQIDYITFAEDEEKRLYKGEQTNE